MNDGGNDGDDDDDDFEVHRTRSASSNALMATGLLVHCDPGFRSHFLLMYFIFRVSKGLVMGRSPI